MRVHKSFYLYSVKATYTFGRLLRQPVRHKKTLSTGAVACLVCCGSDLSAPFSWNTTNGDLYQNHVDWPPERKLIEKTAKTSDMVKEQALNLLKSDTEDSESSDSEVDNETRECSLCSSLMTEEECEIWKSSMHKLAIQAQDPICEECWANEFVYCEACGMLWYRYDTENQFAVINELVCCTHCQT